MRKMSTAARNELVNALARRYAVCTRVEKTRIDPRRIQGRHGLPPQAGDARPAYGRDPAKRTRKCRAALPYDDAVRDALVVLWEASDRICCERLKALMPTLVEGWSGTAT